MANVSPASAIFMAAIPVIAAVVLFHLDTFDPAPAPEHKLTQNISPFFVPNKNSHMLRGSEKIGYGELPGPEDIAYDPKTGFLYTGCEDGWIRRVTLNDSVADSATEKWVNTGGRPLGLAHGLHGELIVADAYKGLLNISKNGVIKVVADEADGLKFKLTDAVDIGVDGTLYFTDASYKYDVHDSILDLLEGRPHGRLLSYVPSTRQTRVLLKDLYFANGVAVSEDKTFVIFCETPMRRCSKYYIQGERKGSVDTFVENMPGLPDNIRYDGHGLYWIALYTDSKFFEMLQRYPIARKATAMIAKYAIRPNSEKNAGALAVDLEGQPTEHYYDRRAASVTTGIKIGEHLYLGSLNAKHIIRLNLTQHSATPAA